MYTDVNFKTKKALKEAVASGQKIGVYSPGPFPAIRDGFDSVEGPHFPKPHTWYARVEVRDGYIVKVIS